MKRPWAAISLLAGTFFIYDNPASAGPCPGFGADTGCGVTISISSSGSSVSFSGQGPYDGNDDTLVGIVNNSKTPIYALSLSSGMDIFGFDGDGVDTYGAPGNAKDSSGYGGPNTYYTNINAALTSGVVNFATPLAANGGSTYFSLENALTASTTIPDLVNNALTVTANGPSISATFTPNMGLTLAQAAQDTGFKTFDWIQTITKLPDPSPFFANNNGTPQHLTSTSVPFNDPPAGGGYTYQGAPDNSYPFYYNANSGELASHQTSKTLSFSDQPADPCLFGGKSAGVPGCNGANAPVGSDIAFSTELAGVLSNGTAVDLGVGFTWTSNFNGTVGGVAVTKNSTPVDPGSGTGGVTIDSINETTNYQGPNGLSINSINNMSVSQFIQDNGGATPVPEPPSITVLVIALAALGGVRFSQRNAARI